MAPASEVTWPVSPEGCLWPGSWRRWVVGFPCVHFCTFLPERNRGSRVIYSAGQQHVDLRCQMDRSKHESESVMGGLYLGVAVAGVEALIAMGLVIAFM